MIITEKKDSIYPNFLFKHPVSPARSPTGQEGEGLGGVLGTAERKAVGNNNCLPGSKKKPRGEVEVNFRSAYIDSLHRCVWISSLTYLIASSN